MSLYGCHNSQRLDGYYVKVGAAVTGTSELKPVVMYARFHEDVLSKGCRYDQRENDPRCEGCAK